MNMKLSRFLKKFTYSSMITCCTVCCWCYVHASLFRPRVHSVKSHERVYAAVIFHWNLACSLQSCRDECLCQANRTHLHTWLQLLIELHYDTVEPFYTTLGSWDTQLFLIAYVIKHRFKMKTNIWAAMFMRIGICWESFTSQLLVI